MPAWCGGCGGVGGGCCGDDRLLVGESFFDRERGLLSSLERFLPCFLPADRLVRRLVLCAPDLDFVRFASDPPSPPSSLSPWEDCKSRLSTKRGEIKKAMSRCQCVRMIAGKVKNVVKNGD